MPQRTHSTTQTALWPDSPFALLLAEGERPAAADRRGVTDSDVLNAARGVDTTAVFAVTQRAENQHRAGSAVLHKMSVAI